jgi:Thermolysin metallopeptidase, alpha-helical domain
LPTVDPLVDRITGWGELTNFVASIAEAAEKYDRALTLYRQMRNAAKSPLAADALTAKIATLEGLTKTTPGNIKEVALQKMERSVAEATQILNQLFGLRLFDPQVELIPDETRNAYWDGKKVNAPVIQDMPDIVYHEAAWPFIENKWHFRYKGQPGALAQSYTDVLTSLVKQTVLKQNAKNADWTIAPGAIAWVTGKPNQIATDRRPLRSLQEPGKAYDDPELGKDPQTGHMRDYVNTEGDYGGIHINSGIPSRAFYETAMQIGSEKAGEIWIKSLGQFTETIDLRKASQVIYKTAVDLYGEGSAEAKGVMVGWSAVGL